MQEPVTTPPIRNDLVDRASALLEAIVHAELELHTLQERCGSLELAISLGRKAMDTAESVSAESLPAKSTSGNGEDAESAPPGEITGPPVASAEETGETALVPVEHVSAPSAPTIAPRPLTIRRPQPVAEEPLREPVAPDAVPPVAAEADASVEAGEDASAEADADPGLAAEDEASLAAEADAGLAGDAENTPTKAQSPAVSRSLEEQAAALRAAMARTSTPAAQTSSPSVAVPPERPTRTPAPSTTPDVDPAESERRAFQPKRSTPLKSRLAGRDIAPAESDGESYSERSAELEQLLRSRDES